MLDKWAAVDVALTKYELVYFDASDSDTTGDIDEVTLEKRDAVREALVATKGGKGLRLRDVAVGRKVVGHLELEDVFLLKVEHHTPLHSREGEHGTAMGSASALDCEEGIMEVAEEYWKHTPPAPLDAATPTGPRLPRRERWKRANEYRLRLHSTQGSLFLRFYSDLEEHHFYPTPSGNDDVSLGHVNKNDALLWGQPIARLCGPEQLHQKLPNLGTEGSAELRDLLELVDRGNTGEAAYESETTKGKGLRKIRSRVTLANQAMKKQQGRFTVPRRLSSMGVGASASAKRAPEEFEYERSLSQSMHTPRVREKPPPDRDDRPFSDGEREPEDDRHVNL